MLLNLPFVVLGLIIAPLNILSMKLNFGRSFVGFFMSAFFKITRTCLWIEHDYFLEKILGNGGSVVGVEKTKKQ